MPNDTKYKVFERESKARVMNQLEGPLDEYYDAFRSQSEKNNGMPSISDVEDMLQSLFSKTRDIYLKMIADTIEHFDESKLISEKKADFKERV